VQALNGRNVLDSAVSLGVDESCVAGADLCGEDLVCSSGVCTEESEATNVVNKKSTGYSKSEFRTAIIITAVVVFVATLCCAFMCFECLLAKKAAGSTEQDAWQPAKIDESAYANIEKDYDEEMTMTLG